MAPQTMSNAGTDDDGRGAMRESITTMMREEMEKLMAELRAAAVAATSSGSAMVVRPRGEPQRGMHYHRVTKIKFPRFGGEDVRGWLFGCEQFFKVDNVPAENKVNLISIHLYDLALMWHRQFIGFVREQVAWPLYREAILQRFGIAYDDPLGEIKKLRQTGSVQDYIDAFDKLLYRVDLPMKQTMSFFMAGLQHEIELAVRMFKPRTLAELYGLCKLEEARLGVMKQKQKMPLIPTPSGQVYCLEVIVDETTELGEEIHEECLDESIPWEPGPEATMEISPQIYLNAITGVKNIHKKTKTKPKPDKTRAREWKEREKMKPKAYSS
ncbi:gypsy/ty3 retroelement polyprotein [Tanacetum coccineum]